MKKSQILSIAIISFAAVFGNILQAQSSTSNVEDQSWTIQTKEKLIDLTVELKQITSDVSLSDVEKSCRVQETRVEIVSLIDEMGNHGAQKKSYQFDAKTPINCTPIGEDSMTKNSSSTEPSKAEINLAIDRLSKAQDRLINQQENGMLNENEYNEKLERIQRAKMQIASI